MRLEERACMMMEFLMTVSVSLVIKSLMMKLLLSFIDSQTSMMNHNEAYEDDD